MTILAKTIKTMPDRSATIAPVEIDVLPPARYCQHSGEIADAGNAVASFGRENCHRRGDGVPRHQLHEIDLTRRFLRGVTLVARHDFGD